MSRDQLIYVSDGDLTFQVKEIGETWIRCRALNTATIGETKNMNIPGAILFVCFYKNIVDYIIIQKVMAYPWLFLIL